MMALILFIAAFLRFFNLGTTPAGLYVDEASIGYNAYSILLTGKDEYGKFLPFLIKSFGDYKAPVYTYLLVPVYKLWGMNMFTTRSVSALSGVITVLFLYLLVKLLTQDKRLAVLSSLVLAISPWHILLSRTTLEANVALAFMIVGLWAFFKFVKGSSAFLIVFALATSVSLTSYHSQRMILPLLYLVLIWHYKKIIFRKSNFKWLSISLMAGLLLLTPTLLIINTEAFLVRAIRVNVLGLRTDQLWGFAENFILNNRILLFIRELLSLYTAYFSPRYLFGSGNSVLRNVYPDLGPFFVWQLPFLILGVVRFIKLKLSGWKTLIVLLLVISPLPASLVREPFGMIRALALTIPLSILIAMGMEVLMEKWKTKGLLVILVFTLLGVGKLYLSAFKFNDYYRYKDWDYGVDQVVEQINKLPDQNIQVDNWRSEIYSQLLFFLKYDPFKYQKDNGMENLAGYYNNEPIGQVKKMDRITVKPINWDKDVLDDKVLIGSFQIIGDSLINQYCLTEVFTVRAPDNEILFIGARTNPQEFKKYITLNQKSGNETKDCWGALNTSD
jgi:4-amino-4-deoxy-L-arabinose transferase-like glycosyltransferase